MYGLHQVVRAGFLYALGHGSVIAILGFSAMRILGVFRFDKTADMLGMAPDMRLPSAGGRKKANIKRLVGIIPD